MTSGGSGAGPQPAGGGDAVHPRHPQVHQHDVGGVRVGGGWYLVAVGGLADHGDAVRRRRASWTARRGPGRRRRPGARGRRITPAMVARRGSRNSPPVHLVVELPAGQLHPLGQPDQAGAAAGHDRRPAPAAGSGLRTSISRPRAGSAAQQHLDRLAGGVLAGVGQPLLHDPVRRPAGGRRAARRRRRPRRRSRTAWPASRASATSRGQVGQRRLRRPAVDVVVLARAAGRSPRAARRAPGARRRGSRRRPGRAARARSPGGTPARPA